MTEDVTALLRAYDEQLRRDAEMIAALSVSQDGPLMRGLFGDDGFVSYQTLEQVDDLDGLIERTIGYFRDRTQVSEFEWKTRGHDLPADLTTRLTAHGFVGEQVETVMAGAVSHLVAEVDLPEGVVVREAGDGGDFAEDVARACRLQGEIFGHKNRAQETQDRLERSAGGSSMWLAEANGETIGAGRLEVVPGTEFAGLWGGVTHPDWRGRGIYRALTAARARHARAHGARYLYCDCLPTSRPILERSGLVKITTTTPYVWRRAAESTA